MYFKMDGFEDTTWVDIHVFIHADTQVFILLCGDPSLYKDLCELQDGVCPCEP